MLTPYLLLISQKKKIQQATTHSLSRSAVYRYQTFFTAFTLTYLNCSAWKQQKQWTHKFFFRKIFKPRHLIHFFFTPLLTHLHGMRNQCEPTLRRQSSGYSAAIILFFIMKICEWSGKSWPLSLPTGLAVKLDNVLSLKWVSTEM